jgi:hypothetical protein
MHPEASYTDLMTTISFGHEIAMKIIFLFLGVSFMEVKHGSLSQL